MNQIRSNDQVAVQGIAGHDERVENKCRKTRRGFRLGVGALLLTGAFLFSTSAETQAQANTAIKKPTNVKSEAVKKVTNTQIPNPAMKKAKTTVNLNVVDPTLAERLSQKYGAGKSGTISASEASSSNSTPSVPAAVTQKRNEIKKWQRFEVTRPTGYYKAETVIKYESGDYVCPTVDDVKRLFNGALVTNKTYKGHYGFLVAACEEDLADAIERVSQNKNLEAWQLFIPAEGYKNGPSHEGSSTAFFWTRTKEGDEYYYWHVSSSGSKAKVEFVGGTKEELKSWSFPILPIKK